MKLTIQKISRQQKVGKNGKPYTSVGILTVEHPKQWINTFGNTDNSSWVMGAVIEVEIEKKSYTDKEGNIKQSWNIVQERKPRAGGREGVSNDDKLDRILSTLNHICKELSKLQKSNENGKTGTTELTPEEIAEQFGGEVINNDEKVDIDFSDAGRKFSSEELVPF